MEQPLFDDLVAALQEAIAHEKGNVQLKSDTITIPDDEVAMDQLIFRKISSLSTPDKQKIMQYANELSLL